MVSCIIPVYNAEPYLRRCLDSVLAQSYRDMEVVLVDDGSTDGSGAICDEYAAAHPHIRVTHTANAGASLARKTGIAASTGRWLTFVDSDDYVSPHYVGGLLALAQRHEVSIAACGVRRTTGSDAIRFPDEATPAGTLLDYDTLMQRFFRYEFWGFVGKIYDRSLFDHVNFPTATLCEDYVVMTQLFTRTRRMAVTETALYAYEYHSTSLSHTPLSPRAFDEYDNVLSVFKHVEQQHPQFSAHALSNVVETCVKLYLRKPRGASEYDERLNAIVDFLRGHRSAIHHNRHMPGNVRRLALALSHCPTLTLTAMRLIKK